MRLAATATMALALLLAAGAPAPGQDIGEVRARLDRMEAELAALRGQVLRQGGAPAGGEVSVRLDRLEVELGRLTGLVEELQFRQRRIAEDGARRLGVLDFRVTELEGGDIAAIAPPEPLGGVGRSGEGSTSGSAGAGDGSADAPAADAAPAPDDDFDTGSFAPLPRNPQGGSQGGSQGGAPIRDVDLTLGIDDIRQGRFDQGENRLERFLSTGPGTDAAAEALYWLGRSRFTRGQYRAAARDFLDGYNADQRGPNAARNLLELGITLGRLGQTREACLTLREVRSQFPDAPRRILTEADAESDMLACGS